VAQSAPPTIINLYRHLFFRRCYIYTKMTIKEVRYNWHQYNDGELSGEDCGRAAVGDSHYCGIKPAPIVKRIDYDPIAEGEKESITITHEDGTKIRVYNINMVFMTP